MRDADTTRIALILPVHTPPAGRAATQIVVFLLRRTRRIEMALLSRDEFVPPVRDAPERFGLLFVAAHVGRPYGESVTRVTHYRLIRALVRRAYAREGIIDPEYGLEIL